MEGKLSFDEASKKNVSLSRVATDCFSVYWVFFDHDTSGLVHRIRPQATCRKN